MSRENRKKTHKIWTDLQKPTKKLMIVFNKNSYNTKAVFIITPPKINMEPGNDGFQMFPIGISFSKGPFSGSMFVLGGVFYMIYIYYIPGPSNGCQMIPLQGVNIPSRIGFNWHPLEGAGI